MINRCIPRAQDAGIYLNLIRSDHDRQEVIMGKYIDVSDATFKSEVLENDLPVLVDFWAPWCGPCVALAPHLNTLAEEFEGQVIIAKVNVDEHMGYAQQYGVQGIPRMILFKNGEPIEDMTGLPRNPIEKLRSMVSKAL